MTFMQAAWKCCRFILAFIPAETIAIRSCSWIALFAFYAHKSFRLQKFLQILKMFHDRPLARCHLIRMQARRQDRQLNHAYSFYDLKRRLQQKCSLNSMCDGCGLVLISALIPLCPICTRRHLCLRCKNDLGMCHRCSNARSSISGIVLLNVNVNY